MRPTRLSCAFLPLLCLGATALNAQTKADQELLKRARSLYYSQGSRPAYIACDDTVDWDAVAKQPDVGIQQILEPLKAMKISFVTRGESHTEVTVTGDTTLVRQQEKIRQQITAFFHAYWTMSDGRLLPGANAAYQIASTPEGYSVTQKFNNGATNIVQMDTSFLITKACGTGSPDVELTPKFAMEDDGLLHLNGVQIDLKLGESRALFEYSFDYQQSGGFYVPQHVTMSMPGALSFTHTFSNCQVLNKNNAPAPSTPGSTEPR